MASPHRLHTLAPDHERPPQEGVEHVTRSMATKRAQVSSSSDRARVVVGDVPHDTLGALEAPAAGALAAPV